MVDNWETARVSSRRSTSRRSSSITAFTANEIMRTSVRCLGITCRSAVYGGHQAFELAPLATIPTGSSTDTRVH